MTDPVSILVLLLIVVIGVFLAKRKSQSGAENLQQGIDFLAGNKTQAGVEETTSGLQSKCLQVGSGERHPQASDKVEVHYHGTLIDGTVFDSSVARGESISFSLNQVIPGWTEGLQLMVEGEKRRLYIPAQLAYGKRSAGIIPANSALIFDVELIKIL